MTNLEVYYDQQLVPIESIVEESIGVKRQLIQLIAKVIPCFEHYIYTIYGISQKCYGGIIE